MASIDNASWIAFARKVCLSEGHGELIETTAHGDPYRMAHCQRGCDTTILTGPRHTGPDSGSMRIADVLQHYPGDAWLTGSTITIIPASEEER